MPLVCVLGPPCLNYMLTLSFFFRYWHLVAVLLCTAMGSAQAASNAPAPAVPAAEVIKLRVVGGLASVGQFTRLEEPFWSKDLARLSQGRFSADIVAFDRAAIPGIQMLQLLQLGVVPFGTMLMSHIASQYPQYAAPDLAGLNPSVTQVRTSFNAFLPYLETSLREHHGIELLAVYIYPAQVLFCKKALVGLADLAGRRIRISSSSQADFVIALGGVPLHTGFSQIMEALETGVLDCAITGASSGNTLGLHTVTSYLYPLPITWGMAIFGANSAVWHSLPAELRALLRRELPQLEARIWQDAERETMMGVHCNSGAPACVGASRGNMVAVPVSVQDERLRDEIFRSVVLTSWLKRCGGDCAALWLRTIGAARAIALPVVP